MPQPSILQKRIRKRGQVMCLVGRTGALDYYQEWDLQGGRVPGQCLKRKLERSKYLIARLPCPSQTSVSWGLFSLTPVGQSFFTTSQPQMFRSILGTLSVITQILQYFGSQHRSQEELPIPEDGVGAKMRRQFWTAFPSAAKLLVLTASPPCLP